MPGDSMPLLAQRLTLPSSCRASPDSYPLWLSRCSRWSALHIDGPLYVFLFEVRVFFPASIYAGIIMYL